MVRREEGFTLVELMVAVAIVILLAAIAIPVFSRHVREATMAEATANIQGILEAQQAYYVRFQQYTESLPACPPNEAPDGTNQDFILGACDAGWNQLGWNPEDRVYFQYEVFSPYDVDGQRVDMPVDALPATPPPDAWGVDWAVEFPGNTATELQPWVAVQASADTDADDQPVFFRGNSYNHAIFRCNQAGVPPPAADPTY